MRTKIRFNPVLAKAKQDKIAGDKLKLMPIAPGFVRFERHDYHYGQQGQVTLSVYTCKDVTEADAPSWIHYGSSSVTWPDGSVEFFDTRVTPCRHECHLGYGAITRDNGERATGTLSRLSNVFCEYYGPRALSATERATFKAHKFDFETAV